MTEEVNQIIKILNELGVNNYPDGENTEENYNRMAAKIHNKVLCFQAVTLMSEQILYDIVRIYREHLDEHPQKEIEYEAMNKTIIGIRECIPLLVD